MPRSYCEETSSLYWEVYNEMNNNKKKFVSEAFKKRGRFSSSTKSPRANLNKQTMINSGREWDWMDDIIEDGIDDYVSVPTGSNAVED